MNQRLLPLLFILALATFAIAPSQARGDEGLVEGRHYATIPGGKPLQPEPGKGEVVEVFAYWCHVCNDFQPMLSDWERRLPSDVAFRYLPAAFTLDDTHARAYFAADSLGALARTHEPTYRAIHVEQALPARGASAAEYAALYAGFGIDRDHLLARMRAPETDARMEAARAFIVASGVEGTPTIIVNGRYRVLGRSLGELLRNTDALVARERAAAGH